MTLPEAYESHITPSVNACCTPADKKAARFYVMKCMSTGGHPFFVKTIKHCVCGDGTGHYRLYSKDLLA